MAGRLGETYPQQTATALPRTGANKMINRTFTLKTDTIELPLLVTDIALSDFRSQGLDAMNECLVRIISGMTPANAALPPLPAEKTRAQDIVGQMMLDGVATGNTRKVIICALWLAHDLPHAIGLVSDGNKFHYVYDETAIQQSPIRVCA